MFDVDRGALIRFTPIGVQVGMYYDNPGVFYDAFGNEVTAAIAASAGFDTDNLLVARRRREAIADAAARIELEYRTAEHVVEEKIGPYDIVSLGAGRYNIELEGAALNKSPIPLEMARNVAASMAGVALKQEEEEAAPAKRNK